MKNNLILKLSNKLESSFEEWFNTNHSSVYLIDFLSIIDAPNEEEIDEIIHQKVLDSDNSLDFEDEKYLLIKDYALSFYNNQKDLFLELLSDELEIVDTNYIKIYRKITISEQSLPTFLDSLKNNKFNKYSGIGVCWSYHINAAETHWGESFSDSLTITLVGLIDQNQIDFNLTGLLNLQLNIGLEEKEIRLLDSAFVNIISIMFNNQTLDVDFLTKA